jgi:tRNA U34 5-carboxymethylaminomethyl modifying GTPase MnmE/TrmE
MDTIFALTTPEGKSGVAVVRVSGQRAFDCFKNFNLTN